MAGPKRVDLLLMQKYKKQNFNFLSSPLIIITIAKTIVIIIIIIIIIIIKFIFNIVFPLTLLSVGFFKPVVIL